MSDIEANPTVEHPIPIGKMVRAAKGMTYMKKNVIKGQVGKIVGYHSTPHKYIVRWTDRLQFGCFVYESNEAISDAIVENFKGRKPKPGQMSMFFDDEERGGKDKTYLE